MPPLLQFEVFSLFVDVFEPYLRTSILSRALDRGLIGVNLHNIRDWATDRHHVTDDMPYGGGGGMVMKVEPVFNAVEGVLGSPPVCPVLLLTPQGRPFTQSIAQELVAPVLRRLETLHPESALEQMGNPEPRLALICGRYEGVDERIRQQLVTDEISIGDYVITGGELPALILIDAVTRLIPGVLGDPDGASDDSFASGLLEYPHYTRPPDYRGWKVPEVLLSGDHARVERWRREQSLKRTWERRPDLLAAAPLSEIDRKFLAQYERSRNESEEEK